MVRTTCGRVAAGRAIRGRGLSRYSGGMRPAAFLPPTRGENWARDAVAYLETPDPGRLSAALERRSGKGGHAPWIFFAEPHPRSRGAAARRHADHGDDGAPAGDWLCFLRPALPQRGAPCQPAASEPDRATATAASPRSRGSPVRRRRPPPFERLGIPVVALARRPRHGGGAWLLLRPRPADGRAWREEPADDEDADGERGRDRVAPPRPGTDNGAAPGTRRGCTRGHG